jgi:hypothetical protein
MVDRARILLAAPEVVGVADGGHSVADYMRSEIDVVESCAGFTDESTPVGEAWSRILGAMERSRYGTAHPAPVPVAERAAILAAGVRSGYMRGHDDTVESCYGDPDEVAADMLPQLLQEADWALPLPEAQL